MRTGPAANKRNTLLRPKTMTLVTSAKYAREIAYGDPVTATHSRDVWRPRITGPLFQAGDRIRISPRSPVGSSHMPFYLRGKRGTIEALIAPTVGGSEIGRGGRGAEPPSRSYRLAIPLTQIWPDYVGSPRDGLRIEVSEPWLVRE
jgi:nitrile hydratase subunit beta